MLVMLDDMSSSEWSLGPDSSSSGMARPPEPAPNGLPNRSSMRTSLRNTLSLTNVSTTSSIVGNASFEPPGSASTAAYASTASRQASWP